MKEFEKSYKDKVSRSKKKFEGPAEIDKKKRKKTEEDEIFNEIPVKDSTCE
jgi:hypothetical protein